MDSTPQLIETQNGLTLVGTNNAGERIELCVDFAKLHARIKPEKLSQELLVKAVKVKGKQDALRVIDATAGLGEDSFLLAATGFYVDMYERDECIARLLEDGLYRASKLPKLANIAAHMTLHKQDSITALEYLEHAPDVVYLDPMFPERTKSASVKKKFQLLHYLEQPCEDEETLLNAAFTASPTRIVVKRPAKGSYLANKKPSYSLSGKAIRFDVYDTASFKHS